MRLPPSLPPFRASEQCSGAGGRIGSVSSSISLSLARSQLFLFPDSRCDSRSLLTWRPGSNQSSIKLISHSGERGRDDRTNYKSHSWPLLSSIKAKRCRRPRSTRRPTPQELISLQEPKLVVAVVAFECCRALNSGFISLGRVPTLLPFPINQLLPSHFRAPSNRIQSPAPLFLCVV